MVSVLMGMMMIVTMMMVMRMRFRVRIIMMMRSMKIIIRKAFSISCSPKCSLVFLYLNRNTVQVLYFLNNIIKFKTPTTPPAGPERIA